MQQEVLGHGVTCTLGSVCIYVGDYELEYINYINYVHLYNSIYVIQVVIVVSRS